MWEGRGFAVAFLDHRISTGVKVGNTVIELAKGIIIILVHLARVWYLGD
jgi:hypothetical protein